jgi:hypothetical protein
MYQVDSVSPHPEKLKKKNCIHTSICGGHTCFQTTVLYRCNFMNGYINTLHMSSFHITFCGEMKCVMHEGVLNIHNSHLWAWKNLSAIHERVSSPLQHHSGCNHWGHCHGPATWQADSSKISDLLETVLLGLLKVVPLAVRQSLWLQHNGAPENCREDVQQWLKMTHPGRWTDVEGLLHDLMHFFLWGHLKEHIYGVPPRTIKDLLARLQTGVTMVDANMFQRMVH